MSVPEWRANQQLFASLPKTTQTIGLYLRDENGHAVVSIGDGEIPARYATRYRPRVYDGVVLEFRGSNTVRVTGPTAAKSKLGKVTAVDLPAGRLTVRCDGRDYPRMPYTVSYQSAEPKVGDTVAIDWDGGFVEDKVTADPDDPDGIPKLTTDQKLVTRAIYPTQSGSYLTVKKQWNGTRGDLLCDSHHSAGWFYGDRIRKALKNDALILSVEVYLSLRVKKGEHPKIGRHYDAKQGDGVSVNDGRTRDWSGYVQLPVEWAEAWRANNGGVSISGGESIYRGIGTDKQSGKLRIRVRQ